LNITKSYSNITHSTFIEWIKKYAFFNRNYDLKMVLPKNKRKETAENIDPDEKQEYKNRGSGIQDKYEEKDTEEFLEE
jgi:hypothetical protein